MIMGEPGMRPDDYASVAYVEQVLNKRFPTRGVIVTAAQGSITVDWMRPGGRLGGLRLFKRAIGNKAVVDAASAAILAEYGEGR